VLQYARRGWLVLAALLLVLGVARLARSTSAELASQHDLHDAPHAGSRACRSCHPSHYASFHRTYHRTMTQEARDGSVLGAWDGRSLNYLGVRASMQRDGDGAYWMSFAADGGKPLRVRVERTVGSHRYQQYLARDADVYFRLPIAWDVAAGRFIHMNQAFLTPDPKLPEAAVVSTEDYNRHVTRWNDNCIFCHNVHANPGLDPASGKFRSQVAELGVACEACHGPGAEHIADNENPLRRYALHALAHSDPSIRNPARMSAERSSEVCGRCHGQRITSDIQRFHRQGDPFVPGEVLAHYSRPLARDTELNHERGTFAARFWPDGTARLTAYEFQGYLQSPCRQDRSFSCESCHAMHSGDPAGQMRPGRAGDAACTACHRALASPPSAAAHSRHSAAVSCRSCHMPDVVYGLVSVHLSHRIELPDPARAASSGRPDACTLCHVDRTRSWAARATGGASPADDPAAAAGLSEVGYRLLAGDPIERAVSAHALGKTEATHASSFAPVRAALLLEVLRGDDYPAVRAIASRSLAQLLAARAPEAAALARAFVATWRAKERERAADAIRAALEPNAVADLDRELIARLRARAADAAIEIGE
jgi:hypothetical protein